MINHRGMTLIEVLVAMAIFSFVIVVAGTFIVTSLRQNTIIWTGLHSQRDARRATQTMIDAIRKAETGSTGSYPIATASTTEFIFYANVLPNTLRERVRFTLADTTLIMGITAPTGSPLSYQSAQEQTSTLAQFVRNNESATPVFTYYGQEYMGTSTPLTHPLSITDIRAVGITLVIEENKDLSPVPIRANSLVQIRNLKSN